MDFEGFGGFQR